MDKPSHEMISKRPEISPHGASSSALAPNRLQSSGSVRQAFKQPARSLETIEDVAYLKRLLEETHRSPMQGLVADRNRIWSIIHTYGQVSEKSKRSFLSFLATCFGPVNGCIEEAIKNYASAQSSGARHRAVLDLHDAFASPLRKLLIKFNSIPEGIPFLLTVRADALRFASRQAELAVLDRELYGLLADWFSCGFIELRRVTWNSPAALLEKLILNEAVHDIRSWDDLRNRLELDRRCYAFFHLHMPNDPLIFVEVALLGDVGPSSIDDLLSESRAIIDPHTARTAVFYSISNAQPGLRGVRLGGLLIGRALELLSGEFPTIQHFVTLSPAPLFRTWLDQEVETIQRTLTNEESIAVCTMANRKDSHSAILGLLDSPDWHRQEEIATPLRPILLRLAALYLVVAKRNGFPRDPVARFHLENGARLERIIWLADTSKRGLHQSASIMVSYLYKPCCLRRYRERYLREGTINMARRVKALARS